MDFLRTYYYGTMFLIFLVFATYGEITATAEQVSGANLSVRINNSTVAPYTVGGARFRNGGISWEIGAYRSTQRTGQIFDIAKDEGTIVPPNGNLSIGYASHTVGNMCGAWGVTDCPQIKDREIITGSEKVLLKLGGPSIPDDPISAKPINPSDINSLLANPDFYNPNFRYRLPDDLGTYGGIYSGGLLDTWHDAVTGQDYTQIQFAYPTANFSVQQTSVGIGRGEDYPQYWIALAMAQEYFNVDMQFMFALGAKETRMGTNSPAPDAHMGQGGVYGHWQVEMFTGMDRVFSYPQLFPMYSARLATAADVATSGISTTEFMAYYTRPAPHTFSPRTGSALILNELIFGFMVLYNNYDLIAHSKGSCFKDGLANSADPYLGALASSVAYNLGAWGLYKNYLDLFKDPSIYNDPRARDRLPIGNSDYRLQVEELVELFALAARNWHSGNGGADVIDFGISLDLLLQMFFGDGGDVNHQGAGGLLLHYYDTNHDNSPATIAIRQRIKNNLEMAFHALNGRSPGTSSNLVSYRYDLLPILRSVKNDLSFVRSFQRKGDAASLLQMHDSPTQIACPSFPELDYEYPDTEIIGESDEDFFTATVTVIDNIESGRVTWTPDPQWGLSSFRNAELLDESDSKRKKFRVTVPRTLAEQYDTGYVWIISEDAQRNGIVDKVKLDFTRRFRRPIMNSAAHFDTTGNGMPNFTRLTADPRDLENLNRAEYFYNTDTDFAQANKLSPAGNGHTVSFNTGNFLDGTSTGMLWMVYDSLNEDGTPSGIKLRDSLTVRDSVGPAIVGRAIYYDAKETDEMYSTVLLAFSEDVSVNYGVENMFYFAKDSLGNGENRNLKVIDIIEISGPQSHAVLFDPQTPIGDYTHIRISPLALRDMSPAGNPPLDYNRWAPITDETVYIDEVKVNITGVEFHSRSNPADGYVDLIRINYGMDFGAAVPTDISNENLVRLFKEGLRLPESRNFTVGDIRITAGAAEVAVTQDKSHEAKTVTDEADVVTLDYRYTVSETVRLVGLGSGRAADSLAPIVRYGHLTPMFVENDSVEIIDTLRLHFSEALFCGVPAVALLALDGLTKQEYGFVFETANVSGDSVVTVLLRGSDYAKLPLEGDSLRILGAAGISDGKNTQDFNTVWAPLLVGKYRSAYKIDIFPNPYNSLAAGESLTVTVRPFGNRGAAVGDLSGRISVLDALGNKIVNEESFTFDRSANTLTWIWDGKNRRGRAVAAGTYAVLITITDSVAKETTQHLRRVGVKK